MNIVVAAQESAGIRVLRLVNKTRHHLAAVLTGTEHGEGVERGLTVAAVARELDVPVLPAMVVKDAAFATELRRMQIDVILNVHSLYLVDAAVLAAPRIGSFNLHPGPLPDYAGLNVPSWAIYNGETSHGVTLHWMAPEVDAGPVAFSASFPLTRTDTGLSTSAKCVQHGMFLVSELLNRLAPKDPVVPRLEQEIGRRRYFGKPAPHDGWVPWWLPARQVVDFVRACDYRPWPSPWGLPRTVASGAEIAILSASGTGEPAGSSPGTVGNAAGDGMRVATADEWVVVRQLRIDGKDVPPGLALKPGDLLLAGA